MLTGESLSSALHAIASGYRDRAVHLIRTTDELDDVERARLDSVVADLAAPADEVVRGLGDALRELGANRALVNECYRAAFYLSDSAADLSTNPLFAYFASHRSGRMLDKWVHYFPIYERHFGPWVGRSPKILEIGVFQGGSLDMWQRFFGPGMEIVGIDVDPTAKQLADPRITVVIGDQEDPELLESVVAEHGPFDLIIDDGGHGMSQQITSIQVLFPTLADGGVYLVEDCHTSYWSEYEGGRGRPGTFIEWAKERVDDLHGFHEPSPVDPVWGEHLDAVHWYDSIVVFDKKRRMPPFCEQVGLSEHLFFQRPTSDLVGEMLATRDAAVAERDSAAARLRAARGGEGPAGPFDAEVSQTIDSYRAAAAAQAELERLRSSRWWRFTRPPGRRRPPGPQSS